MYERISLKLGQLFLAFKEDEEGQGATEYAMVIAFLVIGLTVGLGALGVGIKGFLDDVALKLTTLI